MNTYIHVPVANMRQSAAQKSKVVSQALFGEQVHVGESLGEWLHITTPDSYSGWVRKECLIAAPGYTPDVEVTRLSAHVYSIDDVEYGPLFTLPFGSKLKVLEKNDPRWIRVQLLDSRDAYIQKGDAVPQLCDDLISFSKQFLGLPYTWGGRSSFGYDCSGFIQMLYSRVGIQLPRDARDQILNSRCKPVGMDMLLPGDLIFFGKSKGDIRHVAMSFGGVEFIHTSSRENMPYLRISQLTDLEWAGKSESFYSFREFVRVAKPK